MADPFGMVTPGGKSLPIKLEGSIFMPEKVKSIAGLDFFVNTSYTFSEEYRIATIPTRIKIYPSIFSVIFPS